jgi:hypothetical protein
MFPYVQTTGKSYFLNARSKFLGLYLNEDLEQEVEFNHASHHGKINQILRFILLSLKGSVAKTRDGHTVDCSRFFVSIKINLPL